MTTGVCDYPSNFQSACINGLTPTKKRKQESCDLKKGTSRKKSTGSEIEDQRTLETAIQKLLDKKEKKKLSSDFTHYELQMIWEAKVEDLKTFLNLASDDDVEFLQSLCCDLFLCYDNYRDAPTMDELLKKEENWEQKLTCS